MWTDSDRCGQIRTDVDRFGQMWTDSDIAPWQFRIFAPCFTNEARIFFVNMGRKLTKSELKRITEVAKMERRKSGVKKVEKVVHYNMK